MLTLLFTRHYGKRRYRALYPQAFAFYDEPGDEHKTPHHHVVLVAQPSVSTLLRDLYSKNKLTNKALPSVKTFHLEDIDPSNQGLERVILYSCKTALRTDSSTAANDSYKIIELPKDIWGTNENKWEWTRKPLPTLSTKQRTLTYSFAISTHRNHRVIIARLKSLSPFCENLRTSWLPRLENNWDF